MNDIDRFNKKVMITPGCWLWTGAKKPGGYGNFYYLGKYTSAHRASFVIHGGVLKPGFFIMHKCDNPMCVNPNHLSQGLPRENHQDMVKKGRAKGASKGSEFAPFAKLNWDSVYEIRKRRIAGEKLKQIAPDYDVSEATISLIACGKIWNSPNER